ncbi:MAG TPA: serine/threonine-protein kinase [Ktedonosporobacter sp.]|nr:serine/threonine-protein kinase [Ktedonosporobacter sp.]
MNRLFPGALLLDRYRVVRLLGCGGSGQAYLASDEEGERQVCVKVIEEPEQARREQGSRSPQEEANLLAIARHPRIPAVLALHHTPSCWIIVQEYVPGVTLFDYLCAMQEQGRSISRDEILSIGVQVLSILKHLHERRYPLIVCDITPSNLIRRSDGAIFLIDLGTAHLDPRYDPERLLCGTPGYAPREYVEEKRIGPETDIYSLGATLHHLLTGKPPCKCQKSQAFCTAACFHLKRLRGPVGDLIMWMVKADPQRRPSAGRVQQAFRRQMARQRGHAR